MTRSKDQANYGIVGNVKGKAIAVGPHAKAVVNEDSTPSRAELDAAITTIRDLVSGLEIPDDHRKDLQKDVTNLQTLTDRKPEERATGSALLSSFVDKLKTAGVILNTVVGFHDPLSKLAAWFGIPLPL